MSSVTIVSAFYPFEKSKHTIQEYIQWMYNFFTCVDTPIVLFTDNPFCQMVSQMRKEAGLEGKIHIIQKPFDEVKVSSPEWIEIWNKQLEIDSLAHLHGHELFRVWANKPFFVEEAIALNPFNSEKFVWCDAGCWRDPTVAKICGPGWPAAEKITPNQMHIITVNSMRPFLEKLEAKEGWTHKHGWTHEQVVKEITQGRINQVVVGIHMGLVWQKVTRLYVEVKRAYLIAYHRHNSRAYNDKNE